MSRESREQDLSRATLLQGWEVGYNRDISGYAAVSVQAPKNGRMRLLVMTQGDREPRDPLEPVEVGLYELSEGGDWDILVYDDFDTIPKALAAIKKSPEIWS